MKEITSAKKLMDKTALAKERTMEGQRKRRIQQKGTR